VLHDAQVAQPRRLDPREQAADPGRIDLDAEEVARRIGGGDLRGGLAHAEADLDDQRRLPAEDGGGIDRCVAIRQAPALAQRLVGESLARGEVAAASREAADVRMRSACDRLAARVGLVARHAAHDACRGAPISPPVGDEGVAE